MNIDQGRLVRETPTRRRISVVLVIALAASSGLLAGAKLGRSCERPGDRLVAEVRAEARRDRTTEAIERTMLGQECVTPERATRALAVLDPGGGQRGDDIRLLCKLQARGSPAFGDALRVMDAAVRARLLRRLMKLRVLDEGPLADLVFELEVPHLDLSYTAALYNLRQGNEARALVQMRRGVAAIVAMHASLAVVSPGRDGTLESRLALEALEARVQRAGGSNR